jgi:HAD superfamily hydrolase (TIGR01509 family)
MMKGVIFDFNGTLFLDHDKHILAWNKISMQLRGRPITREELLNRFNGVPNEVIIDYLCEGCATKEENKKLSALKEQYYRSYCLEDAKSFHLIKGAEAYFLSLREQGIPFTIASASIKENIDFFVRAFHLDRYFDISHIVYDDGSYVNKIAMFKEAAKRIHVPLSECRIFEDSVSGIKSAYEAGCDDIVVVDTTNKGENYKQLPGVKQVIKDLLEV